MSATDAFENDLLDLIFANVAIANIGDTAGLRATSTAGSLYLSLSTTAPADTHDQSTGECDYTGYSRKAVARSGAGWTVSGDTASNAALVQFGNKTAGADDAAVCVIIGGQSAGAGNALFTGAVSLTVSDGVNPQFAIGALDITLA